MFSSMYSLVTKAHTIPKLIRKHFNLKPRSHGSITEFVAKIENTHIIVMTRVDKISPNETLLQGSYFFSHGAGRPPHLPAQRHTQNTSPAIGKATARKTPNAATASNPLLWTRSWKRPKAIVKTSIRTLSYIAATTQLVLIHSGAGMLQGIFPGRSRTDQVPPKILPAPRSVLSSPVHHHCTYHGQTTESSKNYWKLLVIGSLLAWKKTFLPCFFSPLCRMWTGDSEVGVI